MTATTCVWEVEVSRVTGGEVSVTVGREVSRGALKVDAAKEVTPTCVARGRS